MASPGGGGDDPADPAPADPASAAELRSDLEAYLSAVERENSPRAREESRLEALNGWTGELDPPFDRQPLLCAAHYTGSSSLVGVLLEKGADVASAFGPRCHPVSLAIHHGQVDAVRFLMLSGRYDVEEKLPGCSTDAVAPPSYPPDAWWAAPLPEDWSADGNSRWCRLLHLAAAPPAWQPPLTDGELYFPPPQPEMIELLVREFKANANGRDYKSRTPLHLLAEHSTAPPAIVEGAIDALLKFGADIEACDRDATTPLFSAVESNSAFVPFLLSRGACANVMAYGMPPLMLACSACGPRARVNIPLLLAASSQETRRMMCVMRVASDDDSYDFDQEWSTLDCLLSHLCHRWPDRRDDPWRPDAPWYRRVVAELLLSGVTASPGLDHLALPYAARLGARLPGRAAARARGPPSWRTHDLMVQLALDFEERRALDEGVRRREARVAELERQLAEAGIDSSSGEEEEESEDDDDDEEESGGGAS